MDERTGAEELDWNDLYVVLAVCRAGSLSGAARLLGCNHSTVFRKINTIETRVGVRFFERLPTGYAMTEAGETALAYGERIETEFHALSHEIIGRDAKLQGNVCLTAPEGMTVTLLPELLTRFRRQHPDVTIELRGGAAAVSLNRREADLAIRATRKPPEGSFGTRIGRFRFGLYASPEYLSQHEGVPRDQLDVVVIRGILDWTVPHVWRTIRQARDRVVFETNVVMSCMNAARAGAGMTLLPCYLGDPAEGLVRVGPLLSEQTLELWILTHTALRHTARVRALMTFISDEMRARADLFAGELGG